MPRPGAFARGHRNALKERRSRRQDLREHTAGKTGGCKEAGQVVPASRFRRKPGHRRADDRLIRVNVNAPYHASVEAARQMPDGGRIIVIGSVNGDRMPMPGLASYALSKSALQGMARGLARDFGPRGITINIVQPGPIDTDANPEDGPMRELMHSFMPIKRHGRPEEVAGMVAWLAGAEAGFVTGAMHTIDGAFGA